MPDGLVEDSKVAALPPPFPAATVILLRDSAEGPEVLMLERVSRGSFAGMWVFPGGRVDPEDHDPDGPADELAAARRAAAREAVEETALVIAHDALVTYSHWMPPPIEEKRFSTWFFLAPAPGGEIDLHEHEAVRHQWIRPAAALEAHAAGTLSLAPPTWATLHSLVTLHGSLGPGSGPAALGAGSDASAVATVQELLDLAAGLEPGIFHTRWLQRSPMILAWRGDVAYELPVEEVDVDAPGPRNRLVLDPAGWRREQDV